MAGRATQPDRPNSDVLKHWVNGLHTARRPRDMWIIDFGWEMSEEEAALYELPFEYAVARIRPERVARQERGYALKWWQHERPRPDMWENFKRKQRYLATARVASTDVHMVTIFDRS